MDISLRLIQEIDSNDLFEIYSDCNVCKYFDINPYTNISQAQDQINRWITMINEKKQFRYAIIYNNIFVGTCGLYSIYWHQNRASIGYDIKKDYWNLGIATKAINELLIKTKKNFNLHRIQATIIPDNIASEKILKKLGFEYEGILKDYEKWKNEYVSLAMYSKLI